MFRPRNVGAPALDTLLALTRVCMNNHVTLNRAFSVSRLVWMGMGWVSAHGSSHEDRMVPGQSFEYAACLQAAQAGNDPASGRIETRAGGSAGNPTSQQIEGSADVGAFLVNNLGMEVPAL